MLYEEDMITNTNKNVVVYPDGHRSEFKTPEAANAEVAAYNDNCDPGEPRASIVVGEVR